MHFLKTLPPRYAVFMVAAAFLNISPFLLHHVGGDIWLYLVWMRCFSEQLWQGDLYPRWCMDVNAGLGTSLFLFYFPLPFYVAALFQPLISLGLSYYDLFVALCFLSSVFAVMACFSWLREVVEQPYALIASILYLFMPYHLETMFFRGSYSEVWCFCLLPLLFKYARRFVHNEAGSVPKLALIIGVLALTHIPITAEALLFTGLYVVIMTGKAWKPKMQFAFAVAWGFSLVVFYLLPGIYYHQFLANAVLAKGLFGWPNNYLSSDFWKLGGLERPLLSAVLTMLILAGLVISISTKRKRIGDVWVRDEAMVWLVISVLSLYMLLPYSAPLYAVMGPLSKVVFPWRMQMVTSAGIAYLLAVRMQWLIPPGRKKTWKTDLGLAILGLWAVSNVVVTSYNTENEALNEKIRTAKITFASEYRSKWTDEEHWKYEYLLQRQEKAIPQAEVLSGKAKINVDSWGWRGIELTVQSDKAATIRLNHSYFPVWQAVSETGDFLTIRPEDKTGLMLVELHGGEHHVSVMYGIANGNRYLGLIQWFSLMVWLLLAWALLPWLRVRKTL